MPYEYDRDNLARASSSPSDDAYMITASDASNLSQPVRALRVAGAGDIHITTRSGADRTLTLAAGEMLYCGATKVFSTGTTATGILGYV